MNPHPALAPGRVAVITGGASGIGLAVAGRLATMGLKIALADTNLAQLAAAQAQVAALARRPGDVIAVPTDVANPGDMAGLRDAVLEQFGEVALLMSNAGCEGGGQLSGDPARMRRIVEVNLWGAINAFQAFVPAMQRQGSDCAVIATGSKQGITCPPGDTAYNISKAGLKVATEALAHDLRGVPGNKITAHLLIPGFTFTGFTRLHTASKPDAAWSAEQVADFMIDAMGRRDFYILCPDNAVPRALDELRIAWAAGDIIENRPALSRWHPDHSQAFADYVESGLRGKA